MERHRLPEFVGVDLACCDSEAESDVVRRTPEQKPGAGRWLYGTAHVAGELVHRLVVGRVGGMPKRLGWKLPGLINPPRTFFADHAAICAVAALDCDDLVIGTGWVNRNYISSLLRHGGGFYTVHRGIARDRACRIPKSHRVPTFDNSVPLAPRSRADLSRTIVRTWDEQQLLSDLALSNHALIAAAQ